MDSTLCALLEKESEFKEILTNEFAKYGVKLHLTRSEYEVEEESKLVARIWVAQDTEVIGEGACNYKAVQQCVAAYLKLPAPNCLLAIHKQ